MSTHWPAAADVRAAVLDLSGLTTEQRRALDRQRCARCPRTDQLRPNGYAYTTSGEDGAGRLAWPVDVCPEHLNTGGTQ